jgi:hypothetical protein
LEITHQYVSFSDFSFLLFCFRFSIRTTIMNRDAKPTVDVERKKKKKANKF